MSSTSASISVFSRIRASARLIVLVLLVFGMKIGTTADCFSHELAEAGLATTLDQAWVADAVSDASEAGQVLFDHAADCTDCSCHHASAVVGNTYAFMGTNLQGLDWRLSGLPPSAAAREDLRPPIS